MAVIDMGTAMQHVKAEEDDRVHVALLLEAAEDSASQFLNRRFFADQVALEQAVIDGAAGRSPMVISAAVRAACLLILGHLYANREDTVTGINTASVVALPMGSQALLTPYRIGWGV